MRGIEEYNNLQGNNFRSASYHGDTFEEFMVLVNLADSGLLWATESCGPCGGNTIRIAKTNSYPGPYPLMDDPTCKWTMGCEGTDGDLICAEHNRTIVKLYLESFSASAPITKKTISEELREQEIAEAKLKPIHWGYDPAHGSDQSAVCFRKGNTITGILFDETADYVYHILNEHLLKNGLTE